jgi:hypothetical protein
MEVEIGDSRGGNGGWELRWWGKRSKEGIMMVIHDDISVEKMRDGIW